MPIDWTDPDGIKIERQQDSNEVRIYVPSHFDMRVDRFKFFEGTWLRDSGTDAKVAPSQPWKVWVVRHELPVAVASFILIWLFFMTQLYWSSLGARIEPPSKPSEPVDTRDEKLPQTDESLVVPGTPQR